MESEAALAELMGRMRTLEADHTPDGWPAVQMRDITALCDAIVARSETGALHLLARVREALGDHGERMQGELVDYCRELAALPGRVAELEDLLTSVTPTRTEPMTTSPGPAAGKTRVPNGKANRRCPVANYNSPGKCRVRVEREVRREF